MVNATAALKEFDIDPAHGVNRGVQEIGEMINKSGDPLVDHLTNIPVPINSAMWGRRRLAAGYRDWETLT